MDDVKLNIKAVESTPTAKQILKNSLDEAKRAAKEAQTIAKQQEKYDQQRAKSWQKMVDARIKEFDRAADKEIKAQQKITQATAREEEKRTKEYERSVERKAKLDSKQADNYLRQQARITAETERSHAKQQAVYERLFAQAPQKPGIRVGLGAMGHFAGAMGLYNIGHVMRGMGMMGIGSELGMGAGAGIGGALLAVKGLELAASAVAFAFRNTAGALISASGTIGNARNLEGMIVETASAERMASHIASNVTDRTTKAMVLNLINKTSAASEFTPNEIAEGFSAYKAKTGKFGPLNQLAGFMTNMSTVSGMGMGETGSMMGQITAEFPELAKDPEKLKQVMMNLWGLGRSGAIEIGSAESITQALGFAGKSGLGIEKGLNLEMGITQLAQRFTGGQSANQAVTGVRRLQETLLLSHGSHKEGALKALLGNNYLTKDATGQNVFRDETDSLARLALASYKGKLPTTMIEERGQKALMGITSSFSSQFTKGMSDNEMLGVIKKIFKGLEEATITVDEFDGALKENKDTIQFQMKQAYNELSVTLETALLPVLRDQVVPMIKHFAEELQKPEVQKGLQDIFSRIVVAGNNVINIFPYLAKTLISFTDFLGAVIPGFKSPRQKLSEAEEAIRGDNETFAKTGHHDLVDWKLAEYNKDILENQSIVAAMQNAMKIPDLQATGNELDRQILAESQKQTEILSKIADKDPNKRPPTPGAPGVPHRSPDGVN